MLFRSVERLAHKTGGGFEWVKATKAGSAFDIPKFKSPTLRSGAFWGVVALGFVVALFAGVAAITYHTTRPLAGDTDGSTQGRKILDVVKSKNDDFIIDRNNLIFQEAKISASFGTGEP